MISKIKASMILTAILIVWASLILFTWRGWFQIIVTIACVIVKNEKLKAYNYGLWYAQDQDVNSMFLGNPDETVSSRIGVAVLMGSKTALAVSVVVDWLFYVSKKQVNHCVVSIELDEQKLRARQLIEAQMAASSLAAG